MQFSPEARSDIAAEHMEVQVVHALPRLLCPIGLPPAGVPFHFICSGRVNRPGIKVLPEAKRLVSPTP